MWAHRKKKKKPLTSSNTSRNNNTLKEDKHIIALIWLIFSLQSYFMVCYYHHQEERIGVIQGIKLIIGLIRGMCILMRHSAMGPLQAEMLSCCALTRLKTRPPGWIVLSLETHYPISMMQYISKTTGPMTSEGNWLCLATALTIYSTLKVVPSKSNLFSDWN